MVTWNLLLFILPPAMLLAGALLLAWGWRGRRVGDHPHCRACGFDLVGLPAESLRCSECGPILSRAGAVRTGRHQRRAGWIWAGAAELIPAMLWLGGVGWLAARGTAYRHYLPVGWLLNEAEAHAAGGQLALDELMARLTSGRLSATQISTVVERALAMEGTTANMRQVRKGISHFTGLDRKWSKLVETAQDLGKASSAQWQRHAMHATAFAFTVRERVRRGDPVPMALEVGDASGGARFETRYSLHLELNGQAVAAHPADRPTQERVFTSSTGVHWLIKPTEPVLLALPDGPQTAKLTVQADIFDAAGGPIPQTGGTPLARKQVAMTASWLLQETGKPTVRINNDPALRKRIEQGLHLGSWTGGGGHGNRHLVGGVTWKSWDPPPVALVFDLFLRAHGTEWKLNPTALCIKGMGGTILGTYGPPLDEAKVDFILRPNPAEAAKTLDVFEIWGQEMVFRNVAIKPSTMPHKLGKSID